MAEGWATMLLGPIPSSDIKDQVVMNAKSVMPSLAIASFLFLNSINPAFASEISAGVLGTPIPYPAFGTEIRAKDILGVDLRLQGISESEPRSGPRVYLSTWISKYWVPTGSFEVGPTVGIETISNGFQSSSFGFQTRFLGGATIANTWGSLRVALNPVLPIDLSNGGIFYFDSLLSGPPLVQVSYKVNQNLMVELRSSFLPIMLSYIF